MIVELKGAAQNPDTPEDDQTADHQNTERRATGDTNPNRKQPKGNRNMVTKQQTSNTVHSVVFTMSSNEIKNTAWRDAIDDAFDEGELTNVYVCANMTSEAIRKMTGQDDIGPSLGKLLEHYDGPGVYGMEFALHDRDDLAEYISIRTNEQLEPIPEEMLDDDALGAILDVITQTLDLDWKVQYDLVDEEFIEKNRQSIDMFMRPPTDDDDDDYQENQTRP